MNNDQKDFINATDINKFVYCPRLWYFANNVGKETLRDMARERNAQYKSTKGDDPRDTGTAYHQEQYKSNSKVKRGGCLTLITGILVIILLIWAVI